MGDFMDANIDLRKDTFLFPVSDNGRRHGTSIIASQLNQRGVHTVLDFINTKDSDFSSKTRQQYMAIKEILRYKYFGGSFAFDVLFSKKYPKNEIGFKRFSRDIKTLGFRYGYEKTFLYHLSEYFGEVLPVDIEFSMEYMLKKCFLFNNPGPDLRQFYLDYIDEKRKKEALKDNRVYLYSTLENLKSELKNLRIVREDLDKQITDISKRIDMLETNDFGRK